jgi:hypothetical protein
MNYKNIFSVLLFSLFFWGSLISANPEEDKDIIRIHRKSSISQEGLRNLIVPSILKDVESLAIKPKEKQFLLFREGQDPLKLERAFMPSLPWHLPSDQFALFLEAHTFSLRQFKDGTYKVDMQVPGLGGKGLGGLFKSIGRFLVGKEKKKPPAPKETPKSTPPPKKEDPKPKGVNNPKTKEPLDIGNKEHKEFHNQNKHRHTGPIDSKNRPDLNPNNPTFWEKKPLTPSGVKQGMKQIDRYEKAAKDKTGLFFGYNPNRDVPITSKYIDELVRKNFRQDPIVQRINSPQNYWSRRSTSSTLDLPLQKVPFLAPYERKSVAGEQRDVLNFLKVIGASPRSPLKKSSVKVQVNDYAIDPVPLAPYLSELTLKGLPQQGTLDYIEYVEWARGTDHANGVCQLITQLYNAPRFLYHGDVILDSESFSESIEDACHNKVNFLNLSIGLTTPISEKFKVALRRAKNQGMGILVAAGNDRQDFKNSPFYKSLAEFALKEMDEHLLFVTGTQYTKEGKEIKYEDGNTPSFASSITLSAPAVNIAVKTALVQGEKVAKGTSLSTAIATGEAAFLQHHFPSLSTKEIFLVLKQSARKTYLGTNMPLPSETFGNGVLDVGKAFLLAQDMESEEKTFPLTFKKGTAQEYKETNGTITITTDKNVNATYQAETNRVSVTPGQKFKIPYEITVLSGKMSFGVLNTKRNGWIGGEAIFLKPGLYKNVHEVVIPKGESEISLVLRNYHLKINGGEGQSKFTAKLGLEKMSGLPLTFTKGTAQEYKENNGTLTIATDKNVNATYQAETNRVNVTSGQKFKIPYDITVLSGKMSFGVLNSKRNGWIGGEAIFLKPGLYKNVHEVVIPEGETEVSLVLRNYHLKTNGGEGQSKFTAKLGLEKMRTIPLTFKKGTAQEYKENNGILTITTDNNANATYQAETNRVSVTPGQKFKIPYDITVLSGKMSFGLLNSKRNGWIGGEAIFLKPGLYKNVHEVIIPEGETEISLVLRNYHLGTSGQSKFTAKLGLEK